MTNTTHTTHTTHTNRLVHEKSPYLLQHAHNPVDWYPWGEDAFRKARDENKPIFLSIGYSTCHWCHVMEHESFENEAIAAVLNERFVPVKVDREERPDIDRVYMTFVQATTGGGGWPMSVWLTPRLKPFYGGTYYPPEDRWGRPGFKTVLERLAEAWEKDRDKVMASGTAITEQLRQRLALGDGATIESGLDGRVLERGYDQYEAIYDTQRGGFGNAPKFPRPVTFHFLMRYWARGAGDDGPAAARASHARDMVLHTLREMAEGGMYDQVGGGFHRYSVDAEWHVPHFEKMLYDQAQLVVAYLEAYQATGDELFAGIARDVLEYVLRDMTGPGGQFYSAEDADSPIPNQPAEQAEGAFYVWEHREIVEALGDELGALFGYHYGVKDGGNAASDPHGEFRNKNILIVRHTVAETANEFDKTESETRALLATARGILFKLRNGRPRPLLDDKTITAWNGLMISAFARAGQVLDEPRYRDAATRAAVFLRTNLYDRDNGRLLRRYRDGDAAIDGYVDDYACLVQGLLDLYETTFDGDTLDWAIALQQTQQDLFFDPEAGGYYTTSGQDPSVLLRMKEDYDGAEPSPNSVAALNLLRLGQLTGDDRYRDGAARTLAAFSARLSQAPGTLPLMLAALEFSLAKPRQVIIAGEATAQDTAALLREVHARYIPNKILLLVDSETNQEKLGKNLAFLRSLKRIDDRATAYVCEDYACQLPTNDPAKLRELLGKQ